MVCVHDHHACGTTYSSSTLDRATVNVSNLCKRQRTAGDATAAQLLPFTSQIGNVHTGTSTEAKDTRFCRPPVRNPVVPVKQIIGKTQNKTSTSGNPGIGIGCFLQRWLDELFVMFSDRQRC